MQPTPTTIEIPSETRAFLEEVLAELSTTFTSPDQRERELMAMHTTFNDMLTKALIAALPAEDVTEFDRLLSETKDNERAQTFLQERVPDIEGVFNQVLRDFRLYAHRVHSGSSR